MIAFIANLYILYNLLLRLYIYNINWNIDKNFIIAKIININNNTRKKVNKSEGKKKIKIENINLRTLLTL